MTRLIGEHARKHAFATAELRALGFLCGKDESVAGDVLCDRLISASRRVEAKDRLVRIVFLPCQIRENKSTLHLLVNATFNRRARI